MRALHMHERRGLWEGRRQGRSGLLQPAVLLHPANGDAARAGATRTATRTRPTTRRRASRCRTGRAGAQLAVDPDEIFQQRQKTCPLDEVFGARPRPAFLGLLRCSLSTRLPAVII